MKFISVFTYFCSFIFYVWCFHFHGQGGQKIATLERYDKTCGRPTMPMTVDITGLIEKEYKIYVNLSITVLEDILVDPRLEMLIERCKTQEDLNSCSPFHEIRIPSYCRSLQAPGISTTLMNTFEPPYECPIKKAVYKTDSGFVDVRGFITFPGKWYWKITTIVQEKHSDKQLMCIRTEMRFSQF